MQRCYSQIGLDNRVCKANDGACNRFVSDLNKKQWQRPNDSGLNVFDRQVAKQAALIIKIDR
jgi:hypothetical protein